MSKRTNKLVPVIVAIDWCAFHEDLLAKSIEVAGEPVFNVVMSPNADTQIGEPSPVQMANVV